MIIPRINQSHFNRVVHVAAHKSKTKVRKYTQVLVNSAQHAILKKSLPGIMLIAEALSNPAPIKEMHSLQITKKIITSADGDILESKLITMADKNADIKKVTLSAKNIIKSFELLENPYNKTANEFNKTLEELIPAGKNGKENNPLYGQGETFIELGSKYGINPAVIASIAMLESGRGTSYAALHKNNIGGIMGRNGLRKFDKVEDCIEIMARTIKKHSGKNIQTISELGSSGKYCDKSVGKEWSRQVKFYLKKFS